MSNPEASSETANRRRRQPPLWSWLLLVVLVILVLAGWGSWRGWQLWQAQQQTQQNQFRTLSAQLEHTRGELKSLRSRIDAADNRAHQNDQSLTALQGRVDGIGHSVDSLGKVIGGGRQRVQMDEVEQLLLIANDEVQLVHDPVTARRALTAADNRLAAMDSPRLFDLRKAISQELAALNAVNEPDLTATALSLSQLIEHLPQQPLRAQPQAFKSAAPATAQASTNASTQAQGWFSRSWHRIGSALGSLFRLRRTDHPIQPMLTAAQAPLVGEVLRLRLDTARTALIDRNTQLYRSELDSAQQWLKRYYRIDDPAVKNGLLQLAQMAALDLNPPLPDISQSLELLRSLRENSAN